MDLDETAARLGVPIEDVDRVHRLAGDLPSAPLPARADVPAILDRLAVRPDDAAEIMAGWPDPGSPLWTPELCWLLDRSIALVRADLGGYDWLSPGPELPRERGPAWRHLYVYAYLALVGVVREYHRDHGIADAVSWATLADLGRLQCHRDRPADAPRGLAGHAELADAARARRRLRAGPAAVPSRRHRHRPAHPRVGADDPGGGRGVAG
ncbi:acyltransferase domain-containing protein [Sphaerimonospora sp. CA-214678]|uniref:acyltransferase domain-containing protein n=1 Tax=Sphaerimonospora sp. CA-214678 TaxID=3240029 RepID=UPI003D8A3D72